MDDDTLSKLVTLASRMELTARLGRTPARLIMVVAAAGSIATGVLVACSSFGEGPAAAVSEAGPLAEAAGADAPSPGFCAVSNAPFCVDFDDAGLESNWTTVDHAALAGMTLDSNLALSRPSSMHSRVDSTSPTAPDCVYAQAKRTLSDLTPSASGRFAFDVWLGPADGGAPGPLRSIGIGAISTGTNCNVLVALGTAGCLMQAEQHFDDGGFTGTVSSQDFPVALPRKWTRVEIALSLGASPPTAAYFVDGKPCSTPLVLPEQCAGPTTFTISPGLYCVPTGFGVAEANYDNIEFRKN